VRDRLPVSPAKALARTSSADASNRCAGARPQIQLGQDVGDSRRGGLITKETSECGGDCEVSHHNRNPQAYLEDLGWEWVPCRRPRAGRDHGCGKARNATARPDVSLLFPGPTGNDVGIIANRDEQVDGDRVAITPRGPCCIVRLSTVVGSEDEPARGPRRLRG
jgi:hypothetical protein